MGFGLLFIGYLLTFIVSITLYGWAIRLVGCIVMLVGMHKLRDYFGQFRYVEIIAGLFMLTGIAEGAFYFIRRFLGEEAVPSLALAIEGWVWLALVLLLHLALLWTLNLAAESVGLQKQRSMSLTGIIIAVLWACTYAMGLAKIIPPGFYYLMLFILIIVSACSIYGCYRHICPEGENETLRKKTGIGFIDRFFEKVDEREARAIEATRAEIEERQRRRSEARKTKRRK